MKHKIFGTVANPWLRLGLLVVLVQQSLVATGTFLMGRIAEDASHNFISFPKLITFGLCLTLSGSLFHYLICYLSTKAQKAELLNYFKKYINGNYNNPSLWRDPNSKSQTHDMMMKESPETITTFIAFLIDATATLLNVVFNTISIMMITGVGMGAAIIIAGGLGLLIVHFSSQRIAQASEFEMKEQNLLNGHLSKSWDNIILGNKIFFNNWFLIFEKLFQKTERASLQRVNKSDTIIALSAFVTTAIVLSYMLIQVFIHLNNPVAIVGLLVMLPRSMQIVMHLQIIQSYWAQWKHLKQKLTLVKETVNRKTAIDLATFIKEDQIQIKKGALSINPQELDSILAEKQPGRLTIRGDNGAGKSTLLMKLKTLSSAQSVYIPAHHQLEIATPGEPSVPLSTGQHLIKTISSINENKNHILLLDEWDANLSTENKLRLDSIIHDLAQNNLVIEVRH